MLLLLSTLVLACGDPAAGESGVAGDGGDAGGDAGVPGDGGDTAPPPPACPVDAVGTRVGTVQQAALVETSGLVVGQRQAGVLWAHNDSGDIGRLFALGPDGASLATVELTDDADQPVVADDWEDLAIGPGEGGGAWLYVGDIGDNSRSDGTARIWMLPEPDAADGQAAATQLSLPYPDGPHDAEALVADPLTGDLFIVTKEVGSDSLVFRVDPLASSPTLEHVASVDLTGITDGLLTLVTAADVSPDGRCVYLRTYTHVLGYERDPAGPLHDAFANPPAVLAAMSESQGEAIAADAEGYWTISEGAKAPVHRYVVEPPPRATP